LAEESRPPVPIVIAATARTRSIFMRRRRGFTLVELLVSLVLIIFVLLVLSEAFTAGVASTQQLKALGDMDQKLRTVSMLLRRDLDADHFEGRRRLSSSGASTAAREGFFRIWQGSALNASLVPVAQRRYVTEGSDASALASWRATDHMLHFTVKLRGNQRDEVFSTPVPPGSLLLLMDQTPNREARFQDPGTNTFNSPWAEVAYFLRRNGNVAGTLPLYTLYRRQRLLVPNNHDINWGSSTSGINPIPVTSAADLAAYAGISVRKARADFTYPDLLYFNGPSDVTLPPRRWGMIPGPIPGLNPMTIPNLAGLPDYYYAGLPSVPRLHATADTSISDTDTKTWTYPTLAEEFPAQRELHGGDVLLTDVISFQVQIQTTSTGTFGNIPSTTRNPLFRDITTGPVASRRMSPHVFDTWADVRDRVSVQVSGVEQPVYDYTRTTIGEAYTSPNTVTSIFALSVTIRAWDHKTRQARQITIIQDM
jgi:prepilin-type N-terminal cleavage/methylation domain-containing protein